jgi:hypothetical protein
MLYTKPPAAIEDRFFLDALEDTAVKKSDRIMSTWGPKPMALGQLSLYIARFSTVSYTEPQVDVCCFSLPNIVEEDVFNTGI